jgi:hypothetical protein
VTNRYGGDTQGDNGIVHLTEEETGALFDNVVRERIGFSGKEFKRGVAATDYDKIGDDFENYPWLMPLMMFATHVD